MWYDPLVTVFLGMGMMIPIVNMLIGALTWGWSGFWTGLVITFLSLLSETVD